MVHHRRVSARIKLFGHTNHDGIHMLVLLQRSRDETLGREPPHPVLVWNILLEASDRKSVGLTCSLNQMTHVKYLIFNRAI
ncbi:hypothetical protein PILCRDRAFT_657751 [Piloderma croceum F 1598]|uniref:Uncharacterized protein n=1 Tax=Piloderma croceum (strain F 1598) TaxID=765440 RepID=A0A0C3AQ65_PILCF|nr:hypothetical protein PILCRDRAFT_657751 [Piloderma croceum F 1598]